MFGIGTAEAGVILIVVLLLFAPTVVAFLIGYNLGQRRGAPDGSAEKDAGAGAVPPSDRPAAQEDDVASGVGDSSEGETSHD